MKLSKKRTRFALVLILGMLLSCGQSQAGEHQELRPLLKSPSYRGLALGLHAGDGNYKYDQAVKEIAATGANTLEILVPFYQTNIHSSSPEVRKNRTPLPGQIGDVIDLAHKQGMRVIVLPVLLLEEAGDKEWRGVMKPKDLDAWWQNYNGLILDLAAIAQEHHAEVFSVGSELLWTEHDRARWVTLIDSVRSFYEGYLIYSANWDHFEPVTFWDKLDAVGISGYFELTKNYDAQQAELDAVWRKNRDEILVFIQKVRKPLIFTEFGYPALDGGAVYPWDYTMSSEVDEEEQARAITAFLRAWSGAHWIEGVIYYEWGLPERTQSKYSPRNRISEKILKDWFTENTIP